MHKLLSFSFCVAGLTASKLWHDTLRLFLITYIPSCTRAILESYISVNALGVLLGGIMAGLVTDSLTPRKVFPFACAILGLSTLTAILCCEYNFRTLFGLDLLSILIFIRGIFIAVGMNCGYVAVGDLYRGDAFLSKASNYLYMTLFGTLAIVPLLIDKLPRKPLFIGFSVFMVLLGISLRFMVQKTKSSKPDIIAYFRSWPELLKMPEFILSCLTSMICIGGFYNLLYIFTDAHIHNNYYGNLSSLQSIGRQCTFGILVCIYLLNIKFLQTSNRNCGQYMSLSMGAVSVICFALLLLHYRIPGGALGHIAEIMFFATCLFSGIAQPAAKTAIIAISQGTSRSRTGSAQSFVTLCNTLIEQQGVKLILAGSYPGGARVYLWALVVISAIISGLLYRIRRRINSYLK